MEIYVWYRIQIRNKIEYERKLNTIILNAYQISVHLDFSPPSPPISCSARSSFFSHNSKLSSNFFFFATTSLNYRWSLLRYKFHDIPLSISHWVVKYKKDRSLRKFGRDLPAAFSFIMLKVLVPDLSNTVCYASYPYVYVTHMYDATYVLCTQFSFAISCQLPSFEFENHTFSNIWSNILQQESIS